MRSRSALLILLLVGGCGLDDELGAWSAAVHTVCGSGPTVPGIDVSYYQGTINWSSVKAAGKVFAIARVSHGTGTLDTKFAANWPAMKQAGLIRGVYQYFEPADSALAQAQLLVSKLQAAGGLESGDLPPVLDLEKMGTASASTILSAVDTWMTHVRDQTGRRPIIYTGSYFWDDNKLGSGWAGSPLWTAHYTSAACPLVPNAWSSWVFWQHSDSGTVSGISGAVDLDRFNGTAAELDAFIQASKIAPPQPDGAQPQLDAGAREGGFADRTPRSPDAQVITDGRPAPFDGWATGGDTPPACTNCEPRTLETGCTCRVEAGPEGATPVGLGLGLALMLGVLVRRRLGRR
jgi:lysozyme